MFIELHFDTRFEVCSRCGRNPATLGGKLWKLPRREAKRQHGGSVGPSPPKSCSAPASARRDRLNQPPCSKITSSSSRTCWPVPAGTATDIARRSAFPTPLRLRPSPTETGGLATARPYRGVLDGERAICWPNGCASGHRLVVTCSARSAFPTESAEADAEGIEHHVSEVTLKAFAQFLSHALKG